LRAAGAWRVDPIGVHALEKLSARVAEQPGPVQQLLQARLASALQELTAKVQASPPSAASTAPARTAHQRQAASALSALGASSHATPELSSVRRFRQAWSRLQAVDRVAQALARKPRNAGPLNSHALVLQTFALLQAASPEYLRRVVDVVETMHWLERATETPASARKSPRRRS
jgi:hypothetical protein